MRGNPEGTRDPGEGGRKAQGLEMKVLQKIRDAKVASRELALAALQRSARVSRDKSKYTRKEKHRDRQING